MSSLTSVSIRLAAVGRITRSELTTRSENFHKDSGWSPWGNSDDWYAEDGMSVRRPSTAYQPTGRSWYTIAEAKDCTYSMRAQGFLSNEYYAFHLHIGTRGWGSGFVKGTMFGEFRRYYESTTSYNTVRYFTIDKIQQEYVLIENCADLLEDGAFNTSANVQFHSGDKNVLFKLTNSPIDPNATTSGMYLWMKYSDTEAPTIANVAPIDQQELISPSPEITANFSDASGSGIDLDGFELTINKGTSEEIYITKNSGKKKGLIKIDEQGFIFKSITPFKSQLHNLYIRIADKHGNISEHISSFDVNVISFNTNIGLTPVAGLVGIGGVNASKLTTAGVITIGDLVNSNAVQLATNTGINLKTITAAIERARIACVQIHFVRGQFGELFSYTINQIMNMTDQEMVDLDIGKEDWQEVADIRQNIGLLYVCLDSGLVDSMKFGDLIWDQE